MSKLYPNQELPENVLATRIANQKKMVSEATFHLGKRAAQMFLNQLLERQAESSLVLSFPEGVDNLAYAMIQKNNKKKELGIVYKVYGFSYPIAYRGNLYAVDFQRLINGPQSDGEQFNAIANVYKYDNLSHKDLFAEGIGISLWSDEGAVLSAYNTPIPHEQWPFLKELIQELIPEWNRCVDLF